MHPLRKHVCSLRVTEYSSKTFVVGLAFFFFFFVKVGVFNSASDMKTWLDFVSNP